MAIDHFIGRQLSEALENATSRYTMVRVIPFGENGMLTDDFNAGRLNLYVNSENIVITADIG